MADEPFNPLDKRRLGESVAMALLEQAVLTLPPVTFAGAGVYALYYSGNFLAYSKIAKNNKNERWAALIYIGKAVPSGARKGGYGLGEDPGDVLYRRLREHAESIKQVENLEVGDFKCRYLVVEDIWIPLGESLLISMFSPLWNQVLEGFGNHDPGAGRYNQQRSPWDTVHPGRLWAAKLKPNSRSPDEFLKDTSDFLK